MYSLSGNIGACRRDMVRGGSREQEGGGEGGRDAVGGPSKRL